MKDFLITQWTTAAAHPDQTAVTVEVLTEAAPGIVSRTPYSFMVDGRFDSPGTDFTAVVGAKLNAAGLLDA